MGVWRLSVCMFDCVSIWVWWETSDCVCTYVTIRIYKSVSEKEFVWLCGKSVSECIFICMSKGVLYVWLCECCRRQYLWVYISIYVCYVKQCLYLRAYICVWLFADELCDCIASIFCKPIWVWVWAKVYNCVRLYECCVKQCLGVCERVVYEYSSWIRQCE